VHVKVKMDEAVDLAGENRNYAVKSRKNRAEKHD
jgi:hypothetical protein